MAIAPCVIGCAGDDGGDVSPADTSELITFEADAGFLAPTGERRYELTLSGFGDFAVKFSDRPVREASLVPALDVVTAWESGGFSASPPGALLTVRDAQGGTWIEAFELGRPLLTAQGDLRFPLTSTDDVTAIPASFFDADLFVQPVSASPLPGRIFSLPGNRGSFSRDPTAEGEPPSWTLEIDDVSPLAAYLWNGSPPMAGAIDTSALVAAWAGFGFDDVPPNASITVRSETETAVAVLTLTEPEYEEATGHLRFTAFDVQGAATLPAEFSESDLFIDSVGGVAPRSAAFTKLIGIDYDPEARCSDDNWTTTTPTQCNPQPSFNCDQPGLDFCPMRCQACFDADLAVMKGLGVGAITLYQPNWYGLNAAQKTAMKVLLGTYNDTVAGLAQPDAPSGCNYGGFPTACGATYARYLIDGACGSTSPWDPNQFCSSGTFITPWKPFLEDGTVIGVQLGNEVLANGFTKAQVVAAAQTMRGVLDAAGYTADEIPIVVSLVLGNEAQFCADGAPPANVDFIAAHPYCSNVAGLPPSWPASGAACLDQVKRDFVNISQADCGAAHVFIGETGLNTGCPGVYGTQYVADARTFVEGATRWACEQSLGLFHFAFVDACPQGGCLAGCPSQPQEGNGYFGLYSTEGYLTKGPLVPKLSPMPSLTCP